MQSDKARKKRFQIRASAEASSGSGSIEMHSLGAPIGGAGWRARVSSESLRTWQQRFRDRLRSPSAYFDNWVPGLPASRNRVCAPAALDCMSTTGRKS
jgi:hypothetical protein